MPLPTSREQTFGPSQLVPSSVLNAIQDAIIGVNDDLLAHIAEALTYLVSPAHMQKVEPGDDDGTVFNATPAYWTNAGAIFQMLMPIDAFVGQRITSVTARIKDTGSTVSFAVYKLSLVDGTRTQLGSTQTSAGTTTDQALAVTGLTEAVADDTAYYAVITAPTNGRIYGGKYVADRP